MERSSLLITQVMLACSLVFSTWATAAPPDESWHLLLEEERVSVYSHEVEGSRYDEWLAQTLVKVPLSALVALIMDGDSYVHWVDSVNKSRRLESVSDTEVYNYTYSSAPWPVDDRDAVVLTRVEQNSETLVVTIRSHAVPDHIPRHEDVIRVPYIKSTWTLTPKPGGEVEVSYRVHNNPGGTIPGWLINSLAVDQPFYTLENLHRIFSEKNKYHDKVFSFISEPGSGEP